MIPNSIRKMLEENALDPKRKILSQDIWNSKSILFPKVRDQLLKDFFDWVDKLGMDRKRFSDFHILGSITGYQYNDKSDIDVQVMSDLSVEEIRKVYPVLPKNIRVKDHPVNYYIVNASNDDLKKADGVYNILKEKWEKKVENDDSQINYSYVLEVSRFFMAGLDNRINEYERDIQTRDFIKNALKDPLTAPEKERLEKELVNVENEIIADVDSVKLAYKIVKGFRNEAFKDEGKGIYISIEAKSANHSLNNLIYKTLENFGYYDKIRKIIGDK